MKLFVYKTVKCEVINVEFLSKDFPLNNSAIIVKWKWRNIQYFWDGGRTFYGGLGILLRCLTTTPLRNHVILLYSYKFMSDYFYFSNNLKDIKDHI